VFIRRVIRSRKSSKSFDVHRAVHRNIISIVKPTRCTSVSNLFYLEWHSTHFRRSFHPSSGVQDCTYSNRHLSNRYCYLLASKQINFEGSVVKPTRCTSVSNLFYFGMTHYTFRTVFPSIIRSSRLHVQSWTPDDGWKDCPKRVECHSKIK
jgi:hypothetical protein